MRLIRFKTFFVLCILLANTHLCFALSVETHMKINEYISRHVVGFDLSGYLNKNLGFTEGSDELIKNQSKTQEAYKWINDGGKYEDLPAWYLPYLRSVNHFHNPYAPSLDKAGFTGIWDTHLLSGVSAIVWSQSAIGAQSPGGHYSWNDVRNYFYSALTSTDSDTRNTDYAETFRGLGQLMHLVQDMSVPEHSRNSGHYAPAYEEWVRGYGQSILNNALANPKIPDTTVLNQPSPFSQAPVPIANLFDTKQYDGSNPSATVGLSFGLSEYSNANFFTKDTIFRNGFPYPVWSSVSEYPEIINSTTGKTHTYLRKVADGELIEHAARGTWFFKYLPTAMKSSGFGLRLDNEVYADYAALLLPRAVGYSAKLLNYFFRGTIELSIPARGVYALAAPTELYKEIRVRAKNTTASGDELNNGLIQLVVRYNLCPIRSVPVTGGRCWPGHLHRCLGKEQCQEHIQDHTHRTGFRFVG